MPRPKPQGWPKLMVSKRLKSGSVGYYWAPPTWTIKGGCSLTREALGTDYGEAKRRCDDLLNPAFDAWRTKGADQINAPHVRVGTFDWMVSLYKTSPKFTTKIEAKTRKDFDAVLRLLAGHTLKDGRRFGSLSLAAIQPGVADRLYEKIKMREDGSERVPTAILAMRVAARAWNVARRDKPDLIPVVNPFTKMGLAHTPKQTRAFTYEELARFVEACDHQNEGSLGTAAMIAFFWLQREEDICTRLSWAHYNSPEMPGFVQVFHHKTGALVPIPLFDADGTPPWPELISRLDATARTGTLMVMRDRPQRRKSVIFPWKPDYFRARVRQIKEKAGIDADLKFMGLRDGGNTEAANAGLTDAQIRALSGHKTVAMVKLYAKATADQRRTGARKRLDERTKKGQMSE